MSIRNYVMKIWDSLTSPPTPQQAVEQRRVRFDGEVFLPGLEDSFKVTVYITFWDGYVFLTKSSEMSPFWTYIILSSRSFRLG